MSDPREPVLVRYDEQGFVDGETTVETVSGSARFGLGLYLMVPVANARAADELAKRLRNKKRPVGEVQPAVLNRLSKSNTR